MKLMARKRRSKHSRIPYIFQGYSVPFTNTLYLSRLVLLFTEGGVSDHDGSSEESKSDQIPWPDTFPWSWRMAGNRAVTGFLRLVQLVSMITRKWSKLKSEYVG